MHPEITPLLHGQGGVASAAQIIAVGVSRYTLRRLVTTGQLLRLPRGIIVDPVVWRNAAPWERHALRARGLMHGPAGASESPVVLSHHSALSLSGVALHAVDDRVHTVRTDGRRSRSDHFVQAHAAVPQEQTHELEGVRAMLPEMAVLQVASTFGVEAGLVSADSCLRQGAVTPEDLHMALTNGRFGNGSTQAKLVTAHASGLAESAGESRCRWLFHVLRLPAPTAQAVIRDRTGQFIARVDFLFDEERTVVEFDGRVKYSNRDALFAEKEREDALRALGLSVVRITWADLSRPQRVLAKVTAAFQLARRSRVS